MSGGGRSLRLALPLLLAVVGGAVLWWRTTPPARPEPAPLLAALQRDFTVDTAGGPLALADLGGSVVIVYFGYTACPDICPTTLANVAAAFAQLTPGDAARATVLMVSVDPLRDTPARLGEYVRFFGAGFHGGTASPEQIAAIAADWGVVYRKVESPGSAMGYSMDHSTWAFLVGPDGARLGRIDHGTPPDVIAARVRAALAGQDQGAPR